jgi:hypothetical protein
MSYHDLSECTLTPAERLAEAGRIIAMLEGYEDELRDNEKRMIEGLEYACSVKQLFWLRDIKDRIL